MIGTDAAGRFPEGFLFGAATSAYQIEGATEADGRGPSIWDTFCRRAGAIVDGSTGDIAVDHYHRSREDVDLMADLGLKAYRFSVAWPRIQATGRGPADRRGLDFYSRLVDDLLAHDITPNVTLYHWDLPQALQDAGGWSSRETAYRFADYADLVFRELHDRVSWWSTINEPWCVALLGYASGEHAPGVRDPRQAIRAIHHTLLGHGLAVARMRSIDPAPHQAIVLNLGLVRTGVTEPHGSLTEAVRLTDGYRNRLWLDALFEGRYPADVVELTDHFGGLLVEPGDMATISTPLDWLGVNYYNDTILVTDGRAGRADQGGVHPGVTGVREADAVGEQTDLGWPITPDGLRELLVSVAREHPNAPPMIITENGAAYDDPIGAGSVIDDERRIRYLDAHLGAVADAIEQGANVRGYMVWSLLDNFEWAWGYSQRFGMVHVDYQSLARTPRRSARWYRDVIAHHGSSREALLESAAGS